MTDTKDEPICGSEPPSTGDWGDCWCTLPPGHDGECRCEPCTERHGAPGWTPPEPADAPRSAVQAADGPAEPRDAHDGAQAAQGGSLRQQIAAAIEADGDRPRDQRVGIINAVLDVIQPQLDRLADYEKNAKLVEQRLDRLRDLAVNLHVGGGVTERDTARAILAITGTGEGDAHNGPTVAECAKDDRVWPLQKEGE